MRVRVSTNPPLLPLKAWLSLSQERTPTVSAFKVLLSTSIPVFRGFTPTSLRLSLDGFELLDSSDIDVVRDGDLICVDALEMRSSDSTTVGDRFGQSNSAPRSAKTHTIPPLAGHKRKRRPSTPISGFESDTESTTSSSSESESDTESSSSSDSESDSDDSSRPTISSLRKAELQKACIQALAPVQLKPSATRPTIFVPPGFGKPQTRSRNLRRRRKRIHEREATGASEGGPVSGANAVLPGESAMSDILEDSQGGYAMPDLPSLSLRNKNKARNFKSLMGKPLPPKIIFGDEEGDISTTTSAAPESVSKSQTPSTQALPRLIPPSSRGALPSNLFVTSIDVEAGMHGGKKKRKMRINYGDELEGDGGDISLDYGSETVAQPTLVADIDKLEEIAEKGWATLERPAREKQLATGTIVGYKALGINPVTYTPEQMLTVGSVVSCDSAVVVVRTLRGREQVSFSGPVDEPEEEEERHTWAEITSGDWRVIR